MKGILKVGLALGALAAGTAWALRRYAPDTYAELKDKATDAVKRLVPHELELIVENGDAETDTVTVDPDTDAVFDEAAVEAAQADENAEEWPDLSQMPEEPEHLAD